MSRDLLWAELGASMRLLRQNAGRSLRQVEAASGWGRGTLSQVENGKARPSRGLVEWYDAVLGGDHVLLSIYAEARGAHGPSAPGRPADLRIIDGDALAVDRPLLPFGVAVPVGSTVTAGWTLVNAGTVDWAQRRLGRVGAHAAARLLASAPAVPIPHCAAGDRVQLNVEIKVPLLPGTFAAYWQVLDAEGRRCFPVADALSVLVTAQP